MKSKYTCDLCTNYFTTPENLEEHKTKKHNIGVFPCNDCSFKSESLNKLDEHIAQCHEVAAQDKNVDIRDISERTPCNPAHPDHTTDCCNRLPKDTYHSRSEDERRRSRGQCRYWSQGGVCYRGNSCRFAHVEFCKFQDQCLHYDTCVFLHYSEQDNFLDSRAKMPFIFREEEFPQMENSRRRNL